MRRDRDPAGRPRNARPRDALGRPLSRRGDPREPGTTRDPGDPGEPADGEPTIPDDLVLDGPGTARLADRLLRTGRPFHAHEVLEASWKTGPPGESDLWQGLAQIAVGLTHAHRGNARGAVTLLRRGAQRVRAYQAGTEAQDQDEPGYERPYGMDLPAFLAATDHLAGRIEHEGLADVPAADLVPGLLPAG